MLKRQTTYGKNGEVIRTVVTVEPMGALALLVKILVTSNVASFVFGLITGWILWEWL